MNEEEVFKIYFRIGEKEEVSRIRIKDIVGQWSRLSCLKFLNKEVLFNHSNKCFKLNHKDSKFKP